MFGLEMGLTKRFNVGGHLAAGVELLIVSHQQFASFSQHFKDSSPRKEHSSEGSAESLKFGCMIAIK